MSTSLPAAQVQRELVLTDTDNPFAVINLVPDKVRECIQTALSSHAPLFQCDERALWQKLKLDDKQPTPLDNRLRLKFWTEYDRVCGQGHKHMNMANVVSNMCTREYFYSGYLTNPAKIAWLLCPPTAYLVKAEEALEFGLEQLRDILDSPHVTNGRVDTKLGELKAKIVAMLDHRVKGAVVQKTLNVNASVGSVNDAAQANTMEDLKKQVDALRRRDKASQNIPTTARAVDVEPE
jgi:hypothetical protein